MPGVTLRDVATLAGVSVKTVSNVVRDQPHVSAAMRERVERAVDELGYVPNTTARRLVTGRTGMVKMAFPELRAPYFAELADQMHKEAKKHNLRLLIEQTENRIENERAVLADREQGLVDGIIFEPVKLASRDIAHLRGKVPLVLLGEILPPLSVDHVMIDNVAAATTATEHLISRGRKRIAFLAYKDANSSNTVKQRLAGYEAALAAAGHGADSSIYVPSPAFGADGAEAGVAAALGRGVDFDGLICYDDLAAVGAMRALRQAGKTVPDDVAVVGWDDIFVAKYSNPSLTTVTPDIPALCSTAMNMLVDRIDGYDGVGRHELVDYRLTVRESTE
jgi:DNA-binding LacI/PurR family transcriptional regulator